MIYYYSFLLLLYLVFVVTLLFFWLKIPAVIAESSDLSPSTFLSVIIAARNEENNIGKLLSDLQNQKYPANLLEVIVVNDSSTDQTAELVKDFSNTNTLNLTLLNSVSFTFLSGKKAALQTGINAAKGELIVTTDADCRVGKNWLNCLEAFYSIRKPKFISGPVSFLADNSVFSRLQNIEFASLVASGAATLKAGYPTMCNGANLAFERKAFFEVGGYKENEHIASGDDEFLFHKMYKAFPHKVVFLKAKEAIVKTTPAKTLSGFYSQRKRWASKWDGYQLASPRLVAFFVFFINFSFIFIYPFLLADILSFRLFLLICCLKCLLELMFLYPVLRFFEKSIDWPVFLLLQFIYPFYVSFFAFSGKRKKKYLWKGRVIYS
jgi:cellulose synthase/poly-beta-1,6-N-acetylglucosamine synthase-like glycosyltransferase